MMIYLNANDVSKTIFEKLMIIGKHLILNYWWVIVLIWLIYLIINLLRHLKITKAIKRGLQSNNFIVKFLSILVTIAAIIFALNLIF